MGVWCYSAGPGVIQQNDAYNKLGLSNMRDALRLTYEPDSDGTGKLIAEVRSKGFSGISSAWFSAQDLIEFAHVLANAYPLRAERPVMLRGGFSNRLRNELSDIHVGLEFYPIGSVGLVGCRVSLSTSKHDHERPLSQSLVAAELETNYEPLRSFAQSIEMLANGSIEEAVLVAEA
jgi:hypothetical protein